MTPEKKPPRPASFCLPPFIELKPVKLKMRRPYWSLRTDKIGAGTFQTKASAYRFLDKRLARADMTDAEIYRELKPELWRVACSIHNYVLKDNFYEHKKDKHEWHYRDEVDYYLWLCDQLEKNQLWEGK